MSCGFVIALRQAFWDAAAGRRGWAGIGNTAFSRIFEVGVGLGLINI